MSILRTANGAPLVTAGGAPVLSAAANIAAPAITRPPAGFEFGLALGTRRGWPGSYNGGGELGVPRAWSVNFSDETESFSAVRWCPTWLDAPHYRGSWMPAGGDVWRVIRKGTLGADAQTLVLFCSANPAVVPSGDRVVLWTTSGPGTYGGGTLALSGYNLPLKSKMLVTGGQASGFGDADGQRIIEIATGVDLPAIDYTPPTYTYGGLTRSTLHCRHWAFYADTAAKALRHPIGQFVDISLNSIIPAGGYVMLGGHRFLGSNTDWTREWNYLGASLTEELYRLEQEGLAQYCGLSSPLRVAVELEDEPMSPWVGDPGTAGFGSLLREVWLPIARTAWGNERTLVVKPSGRAGLNNLITEYDIVRPLGANLHLAVHIQDGSVVTPNGPAGLTNIGETDWIAGQIKARMNTLGYPGGGATLVAIDAGRVPDDWDRGQRLGRMLTSLDAQGLYTFAAGMTTDLTRASEIQTINGRSIEAFRRGEAPYARRAGLMTV